MRPSEKPLVSIVTPVLDRGDTIELALRSVAAQTYPKCAPGGSPEEP